MKNKIYQTSPMVAAMDFDSTYADTGEENASENTQTEENGGTEGSNETTVVRVPLVDEQGQTSSYATVNAAANETGFTLPTTGKVTEMLWKDGVLFEENGFVHTYGSAKQIGGVNAAGVPWQQVEEGVIMDEPYLKEWGWQCCLRESSEENNYQPMELYRWLYRCMKEGLTVAERSIKVGNGDAVKFDVAVSKKVKEGCADIYSSDEVYAHIRSIFNNKVEDNESNGEDDTNGGEDNTSSGEENTCGFVNAIINDDNVEIMRIPVLQFGITDASVLLHAVCRVMEDDPTLCFPFTPRSTGSLLAIQDENNVYQYVYSVVPNKDLRDNMKKYYEEVAREIKTALGEKSILPGNRLNLTQKKQVLKFIHDYIVEKAEMYYFISRETDAERKAAMENSYLLPLMYCVFEDENGLRGNCMSYTQALNYFARLYDIEAIQMFGMAQLDLNNSGSIEDTEKGAHAWSALRLSDEPYGSYPSDPSKWSSIDAYWDEPLRSGNANESVQWDYFLNTENIYPEQDTERYQREHREIIFTDGYGNYPFVRSDGKILTPSFNCPYDSTEY